MFSGQIREYDVHGLHPMLCPKTSDWGLRHKTNPGCNIRYVQQLQPLKNRGWGWEEGRPLQEAYKGFAGCKQPSDRLFGSPDAWA